MKRPVKPCKKIEEYTTIIEHFVYLETTVDQIIEHLKPYNSPEYSLEMEHDVYDNHYSSFNLVHRNVSAMEKQYEEDMIKYEEDCAKYEKYLKKLQHEAYLRRRM